MLSRLVIPVAAFGFFASLAVQAAFWLGYNILGPANGALFVGIFVVWFPTVMLMQKSLGGSLLKSGSMRSWSTMLIGAPEWMVPAFYAVFAFGMVNFLLGLLGVFSMEGDGFWRVGSSHAMVFYFAAWSLNTAVVGREDQRIAWGCEQDHPMAFDAKFCAVCGAPLRKASEAHRSIAG